MTYCNPRCRQRAYLKRQPIRTDGYFSGPTKARNLNNIQFDALAVISVIGYMYIFSLTFIADTCPMLIAAIPSRVHDSRKPGDLLKVGGDPLDDAMDAARYGKQRLGEGLNDTFTAARSLRC